jgi:hypothetical protein
MVLAEPFPEELLLRGRLDKYPHERDGPEGQRKIFSEATPLPSNRARYPAYTGWRMNPGFAHMALTCKKNWLVFLT